MQRMWIDGKWTGSVWYPYRWDRLEKDARG